MAPTTNIGSSTPIDSSGANLGSDLRRKVINDAAASLTALAAAHHRNTTGRGSRAYSSNLTADQALNIHVIDAVAPSLPALLTKLDGYHTKDAERPYTLHLADAHIDTVKPGFFTRLLNATIDPTILSPALPRPASQASPSRCSIPSIVLPGALGAVALLTALFGFSVLPPISWSAIALIVLGVALLVIEMRTSCRTARSRSQASLRSDSGW